MIAIGAGASLIAIDEASGALPEYALQAALDGLPRVDLAGARRLAPDLVLAPAETPEDAPDRVRLRADGADIVEFIPHDLEEVIALCRALGPRIVGDERTRIFEAELSRPLAAIGGSSYGLPRLRVLGIVALHPLAMAGGHSFETDLIEIAGAQSVSHGGAETRMALAAGEWSRFDPDLLLVMLPREPSADALRAALGELPDDVAVRVFAADAETFWLERDQASAHRLRTLIAAMTPAEAGGDAPLDAGSRFPSSSME